MKIAVTDASRAAVVDSGEVWDTDEAVDRSSSRSNVVGGVDFHSTTSSTMTSFLGNADPFAHREGKTLTWTNVSMTLAAKGDKPERCLLSEVWGEVPNNTTTAIMGPSGAGKTCLLNILAGRSRSRGKVSIHADVRWNNYMVDPTNITVRKQIAFVDQDNSLPVTSTPREAIRFSAKLRLSRETSEQALNALTERMIAELGLSCCADTIIGNGVLIKGISGGERKRTSVGVELIVKPKMVFLDEPTSGLDSYSAVQLCHVLKKVANCGASVLFTIHQPSSEIFNSFDNLILLNKGLVMYHGPATEVTDFFEARGNPVPPNYNPGDWIMNVAQSLSIEELKNQGFFPRDHRRMGDAFTPKEGQDALGMTIANRLHPNEEEYSYAECPPPGTLVQTSMLLKRELNNLYRDITALVARFGLTIFMSTLIGIIFFDVGSSDPSVPSNIQSRFGALVIVLMMSMFGTAQHALISFPQERPVFLREYSTNHYSVVSYFVSRLTIEACVTFLQVLVLLIISFWLVNFQGDFAIYLATTYSLGMASTALGVFLGCCFGDPELVQEMLPLLFIPQMLFAGFFVTPGLIPAWLRWAQYLCTMTFAIRILLVAEFEDCSTWYPGCEKVLNDVEADPDEIWWNWLILVVLFCVFRVAALAVLRMKAMQFF